jgi:hypothetical protein
LVIDGWVVENPLPPLLSDNNIYRFYLGGGGVKGMKRRFRKAGKCVRKRSEKEGKGKLEVKMGGKTGREGK